jgi:hypothetical protein
MQQESPVSHQDSPAKQAILNEWDAWSKDHPDDTKVMGGMLFFTHLQEKRADLLLDIKSHGDKWRILRFLVAACGKSAGLRERVPTPPKQKATALCVGHKDAEA